MRFNKADPHKEIGGSGRYDAHDLWSQSDTMKACQFEKVE